MTNTIDFLKRYLRSEIEDSCAGKKIVIYGTGNFARSFLNITGIDPVFYVETSGTGAKNFRKKVVESPRALEGRKDELFIFICSQWSNEISKTLTTLGYEENKNFKTTTFIAPNQLILYCKDHQSALTAIQWLNNNIEYVKLRYFDQMIEAGEDWDILVRGRDLQKVLDCGYFSREKTDFAFDFKWSDPIGFQDEQLYFPEYMGREILKNRTYDPRGFFRVSENGYEKVYIYHLTYQKNIFLNSDNLKKYKQEFLKITYSNLVFNYENFFHELTLENFHPPLSHARKWASVMKNSFLMRKLHRSNKVSQIGIFVCRENSDQVLIELLREYLREAGFIWLGEYALSGPEKERFRFSMRGGCWSENPASKAAGGPSTLVFFIDPSVPPVDKDIDEFSEAQFQVEAWRNVKHKVRSLSAEKHFNPRGINWLHSVEDEKETVEAVSWLEPQGQVFFKKLVREAETSVQPE